MTGNSQLGNRSGGVEMFLVLKLLLCLYLGDFRMLNNFVNRGWIFLRNMSEIHQKFGPWMFQGNTFVAW